MREKIRLILNILLVLAVAVAWTGMIRHWGRRELS